MASYRGGWNGRVLTRTDEFWKRVNGNFLDIAVLEWCKLFADNRGAHCWRNILTHPDHFYADLLAHLELSSADFEDYCGGVRTYRDKFVAHLDADPIAKYPRLNVAIESTKYLFTYLRANEDGGDYFEGLPLNLDSAYRVAVSQARASYAIP